MLPNLRVADADDSQSAALQVWVWGSEQVELVQTGSCRFLPRVLQLEEAWQTLFNIHGLHLFPMSGHATRISHILQTTLADKCV